MKDRSLGFTLIEMVVAMVLSAILMVGLLRVVTVVSLESNQLRSEQTDYVAAGMLADRIREDLVNARGIALVGDAIVIAGFETPENRPGMIRYERALVSGTPVLIRRTGRRAELLWVGFGSFDYLPYEELDVEVPISQLAGGLPPMPGRFRVAASDGAGRILFSEVIHHHAN